ncbi:O-methyltransferase [Elsinoe ampelina]|uniref:O-methyltransferase n=1 Tax=Elsinoe ampelina TaxID=302913 RepID=A0A6A6GNW0_9PEZI|nr:O-methyltransferase [Elsinoe ampelina]
MATQPPSDALHEKDPRWTAVDDFAYGHLFPASTSLTKTLGQVLKHQHDSGLPDIAVSPLQGAFLALQTRLLGSKNVLEVGTLGGYSTTWFAASDTVNKVVTVDFNAKHTQVAKENIHTAGLSDKVEFITDTGINALTQLCDQVKAGSRPEFDFVFIDADKENNLNYVYLALDMTPVGACIIVDNIVRRGKLADPEVAKTNSVIKASRECVEAVGKDDRLDATLIQTVGEKNYDGMLICRKVK